MKRYRALLATTWWLWLIFAVMGVALVEYVDPIFVITFPLCLVIFFYFAYVRFDDQGNRRDVDGRSAPRS